MKILNKKTIAIILGVSLLSATLSGCDIPFLGGNSKDIENTISTARTEIWKVLSGGGSSNATVAIMDNGKIVYKEGFGMADRTAAKPVNSNTQFNIGSVSKVFTAAAVMQLVEQGKLALDKPVVDYMPVFTMEDQRYLNITVRMLVNHTSGMQGTYAYNGFATAKDSNYISNFLKYLSTSTLKSDPGKVSVYCNDGFTLAEALIQHVAGMSFSDYVNENLFKKAAMNDSSCYFKDGNTNVALNYDTDTGKVMPKEYVNIMGSGGISSTAVDLCKFGDALINNKLMSKESFTEYSTPQYGEETVPVGKALFNCGLGWDYTDVPEFAKKGIHMITKNGGTLFYSSQLFVLPEDNISMAIIFSGTVDAAGVATKIANAYLEEKGIIKAEDEKETQLQKASIPAEMFDYEGIYGNNRNIMKFEFNKENNSVVNKVFNGSEFETQSTMEYKSDGFFHSSSGEIYTFAKSFDKKLLLMYDETKEYSMVRGEGLTKNTNNISTLGFENKKWIPNALSTTDFVVSFESSGSIPELPGYIFLGSEGLYCPYLLKNASELGMCLAYSRDLSEPQINKVDGKKIISVMGETLVDAENVIPLTAGEKVSIVKENENQSRVIKEDGVLKTEIPEGTRIVIIAPDDTITFDSISESMSEDGVDVTAGSYIIFVGDVEDTFTVEFDASFHLLVD